MIYDIIWCLWEISILKKIPTCWNIRYLLYFVKHTHNTKTKKHPQGYSGHFNSNQRILLMVLKSQRKQELITSSKDYRFRIPARNSVTNCNPTLSKKVRLYISNMWWYSGMIPLSMGLGRKGFEDMFCFPFFPFIRYCHLRLLCTHSKNTKLCVL